MKLASACVCCEITHHRGYDSYGHRRVYVVRSHISLVRFVTGIGVCMLGDHTSQEVRFDTGIGVCMW